MTVYHDFFALLESYARGCDERPDALGPNLARLALKWRHNAVTRHQLAHLDDEQLQDIGISRGDAAREAARPFWR
jgi:uncharacterized protein YjiS (DUF1127 family)